MTDYGELAQKLSNQRSLADSAQEAGAERGVDAAAIYERVKVHASDEIEKAKEMDVTGTPTMFVNGRRIPNSVEWTGLKATIDNEIEYQKTAKNAGEDCGCETKLAVPGLPSTATSPIKKQ